MAVGSNSMAGEYIKIILSLVFGSILGVLLCGIHLIMLPAEVVPVIPKETSPATVYVLQGSASGGNAWTQRVAELNEPGRDLSVTEGELNMWISKYRVEQPEELPMLYMYPSRVNFRVRDNNMHVSTKASSGFGEWTQEFTISAILGFENTSTGLKAKPSQLYLGSFRIHPMVSGIVWNQLVGKYNAGDDFKDLWSKMKSVEVSGARVQVSTRG